VYLNLHLFPEFILGSVRSFAAERCSFGHVVSPQCIFFFLILARIYILDLSFPQQLCWGFRCCGAWHCVVGCFLKFCRNMMPSKCRETLIDAAFHLRRPNSCRMYMFASQLQHFACSSLLTFKSLFRTHQCGHISNLRGSVGILLHGLLTSEN